MICGGRTSAGRMVVACVAALAVLVMSFAMPAQSAGSGPGVASWASLADLHEDGSHYHDEDGMVVVLDQTSVPDHHHADHTHEKAGLWPAVVLSGPRLLVTEFAPFSQRPFGDRRSGIDRPPRASV